MTYVPRLDNAHLSNQKVHVSDSIYMYNGNPLTMNKQNVPYFEASTERNERAYQSFYVTPGKSKCH